MKIWQLIQEKPHLFLGLTMPLAIFFLTIGLGLGSGNDDKESNSGSGTPAPSATASSLASASTATPALAATATPVLRTNCDAIRGSDYRSAEERTWFLQNCQQGVTTAVPGSTPVANAVASNPATSSTPSGAAPRVSSGQVPTGDRLVIPKIGVNANIDSAAVIGGAMPDPVSYFNAVWYDFGGGGLGGHPNTGGNTVLAGHVDSARYGAVVFYSLRNLVAGDTIEYYTNDGRFYKYAVTAIGDYLPSDNWTYVVSSGTADLTIITCIGTFDPTIREYSHRRVVFAKKI